ncbi:glycosyltransferase family 4 protein [Solirubrobacter ginsenosidimutans]|uniref:Glycosyltransferase family 4 protein n=1 Tax=Solirubrobacter ginsenosidimutans TaxID=490573 RepID=A0A9X3S507_9ACTN|nr:glycosyltransferase family 4 protein [Solirubrobacter ginsenosidimutans]MDA0167190.1 glycosyltransferase family 4 protein [Solirubrobacter ginsenosidimutans]
MKPVLFVTNHAPAFRIPAFKALHERENVVFALIGGDVRHGGGGTRSELPFPAVFPEERTVARMAASGRYRAVVAGLSGKVALPAAYAGARAGRVPFVLWATIWRHPRTPAHTLSYIPLRHIYRHADAIATYGPHVSAYVNTKHPHGEVFAAPQSVDVEFWTAKAQPERHGAFQILYAGRLEREKGVDVLARAWDGHGTLVLAGEGPLEVPGALRRGKCEAADLRNLYAGSDVVVVPSVPTRDFLEPWGLVVNEAFHQGVPVIATDAVGAAAGGLVRHERTGLVVPAGDAEALRGALRRLQDDPALRAQLGAAGRDAAAEYTPAAWAEGMSQALISAEKAC